MLDPAYRERERERLRRIKRSPEYQRKHRERERRRRESKRNDPAYREHKRKLERARRADPVYQQYKRDYHRKKMEVDPVYKAKRRASSYGNPTYRMRLRLRARLYNALQGGAKSGSAVRDLGCSIPELKTRLESKFQPGMSWDNYGEWHIDHIRPLSSFDLTDRAQLLQACHFSNLQPLWAVDNLKKGARA